MGIFPYVIVLCVWLLSINEVFLFQYVDAVVLVLVLLGIHKPYSLVLSAVFALGILSAVIFDTTFGVHSAVYMFASVLWLSGFYKRYAKYVVGYYLILTGFIVLSQVIFGIERYLMLWEFGVIFEYVIRGIFTASLIIFVDIFIPRPTIELPQKTRGA